MGSKSVKIEDLMADSGVKFGTRGARGLAVDMTDEVCYAYTWAFIQYLEEIGQVTGKTSVAIGGDLRPSTDRIMTAAAKAVEDRGHISENCGKLPSPALAGYGIEKGIPTVMVTGSHIPEDRNGIKYTRIEGEILKKDESGIKRQIVVMKEGMFNEEGMFSGKSNPRPENRLATTSYVNRYLDFFPGGCLKGKRIGVYQHSAVGRDQMVEIFEGLGSEVIPLGFSDTFIPVDTEAIRQEDVKAAQRWAGEPCILTPSFLRTETVIGLWSATKPVMVTWGCCRHLDCSVSGSRCGCNPLYPAIPPWKNVVGSKRPTGPELGHLTIEGMQEALKNGFKRVVGYEANGGFHCLRH